MSASLTALVVALLAAGAPRSAFADPSDVVLYASEAAVVKGNWSAASSSGAAGGRSMKSADQGWSSTDVPLASPSHYFEMSFDAPAGTVYRVWLRLRAAGNSKWNDGVWVQFSDSALANGSSTYRIGTTSALMVNLERCSGCGTSGWGWQNTAYWLSQPTEVKFAASGTHKIRVQTREDGVEVDQIVLSPSKYRSSAPGPIVNDSTIVPKTSSDSGGPVAGGGDAAPYNGSPVSLPGTVEASRYDKGGQNVAYYDTSSGNEGGSFRSDDVDIQPASGGGYNVGWTTAGEWLKYAVNVKAAGNYTVQLRVAATSSRTVAVSLAGASATINVPNTGGWQSWSTVSATLALAGGAQSLKVTFPTGGVNLRSISVAAASAPAPAPAPDPAPSGSGGTFRMLTWNIQHGETKSGGYDPAGQAKFIASQNPHVVVLQEVETWDENQPQRYKTLLEQYTGVSWHVQWAPVIDKNGTEGNVVLTRLPVVSSSYHQMHATGDWTAMYSNRSVARTTVSVGGVQVHLFSTHLDWYNTSHRTAQLLDMMAWTEQFGPRRIVGGDFNSWWGEYWITTMMSDYYDTWQDVTGSNQNGHTVNNAVRFDYLFRSKDGSNQITPLKVWVPATNLSDHYPVVADFRVTP